VSRSTLRFAPFPHVRERRGVARKGGGVLVQHGPRRSHDVQDSLVYGLFCLGLGLLIGWGLEATRHAQTRQTADNTWALYTGLKCWVIRDVERILTMEYGYYGLKEMNWPRDILRDGLEPGDCE
jgi:hypothetical protein